MKVVYDINDSSMDVDIFSSKVSLHYYPPEGRRYYVPPGFSKIDHRRASNGLGKSSDCQAFGIECPRTDAHISVNCKNCAASNPEIAKHYLRSKRLRKLDKIEKL